MHKKTELRALPFSEEISAFFHDHCKVIQPAFPNWERSFISGLQSPLFEIEHRIQKDNPHLLLSKVSFKSLAEGPPGHVHGGASAALIDESMGIVVWHNQLLCLTQTLSMNYLMRLPLGTMIFLVTEIVSQTVKKIETACTLYDEQKTPYVSAQGVFHRLTPEQLKKFFVQKNH